MDYVYTIFNNFKYFYNSMNPATLSGAIDVIVVEQPDGSLLSTPFHVRFGKLSVFNSDEKFVDIQINGTDIANVKMKLGDNGVAFFVEEVEPSEELPEYLATSPLPGDIGDEGQKNGQIIRKEQKPVPRRTRKRAGKDKSDSNVKPIPKQKQQLFPAKEDLNPKQRLPFSSSIFSCRKYRSLPDLSFIAQTREQQGHSPKSTPKKSGHKRKLTFGAIDKNVVNMDRPISHSKSVVLPVEPKDLADLKQGEDQPQKRSSIDTSSSEDEDSTMKSRNISDIADGALSDSEIDRQRYETHNDPEWKWGEYPETKAKEKSGRQNNKEESKPTGWSWFRWRSKAPEGNKEEEEGVPLSALLESGGQMDPSKLEKYFGTSCASSQASGVDSGQGISTATSPASPMGMSMESLVDESGCPTVASTSQEAKERQTMTSGEIKQALRKDEAIEKELLATPNTEPDTPQAEHAQKTLSADIQRDFNTTQTKQRSISGTSFGSDTSGDEEVAEYFYSTTPNADGRPVRFKRTLRLKSEQLKDFKLEYGSNEARFSITTKFQGTAWCSCHVYLLRWSERLVISDIDGTITRSDVLGHVIPAIGGTWAHAGVAELYTRIKNNGYRMVYLSSRAIGQSHYTKTYLQSIAQGSRMLPDGPVLLSPTSVLMAFRKEVIERKPEEFKIACLTDLKNLFPVKQPFFAGFGNRETDVKSYVAAGIPLERILIINPEGSLKRADKIGFVTSYSSMAIDTVDYLFPPLMKAEFVQAEAESEEERAWSLLHTNFTKPEKYSTFTHWRARPDDHISEGDLETYEQRRKESQVSESERKKSKSKK
ncbi:unnamed protein product [Bursaphelenchus xylophilus]|uniref:(pine wood nematode) hypothetical protein n=1 Tax=Bursaphelenchus xylophilus TaxID=6326 RepID=A0A1I7S8E6_BURXY|nr:unnamed protein product [Bursaphelenchus xylophilus]CAG9121018.1 unnamed protein product [Bursaphelenchus xylophilus]